MGKSVVRWTWNQNGDEGAFYLPGKAEHGRNVMRQAAWVSLYAGLDLQIYRQAEWGPDEGDREAEIKRRKSAWPEY